MRTVHHRNVLDARFFSSLLGRSKKGEGEIAQYRNTPLALDTFMPAKCHSVKARWRLVFSQLKLMPYVRQPFDHSTLSSGIGLSLTTSTGYEFSLTTVVIVVDGSEVARYEQNWGSPTGFSEAQEAMIENGTLLRAFSQAKEVYISIIARYAPFGQLSFKLSEDQLRGLPDFPLKVAALA